MLSDAVTKARAMRAAKDTESRDGVYFKMKKFSEVSGRINTNRQRALIQGGLGQMSVSKIQVEQPDNRIQR